MKMLFVNYINSKSPLDLLKKYHAQHKIFVTSVLAKQKEAIASLISGKEEGAMFVEGLTKLRQIKKNYDCPVLYLDNDCVLLDTIDDLFTDYDFDVAVVYRYNWEEHGGHQDCLGGFLFFSGKRPKVEDKFLKNLIIKTRIRYEKEKKEGKIPWYYDQLAINDLVGRPPMERNRYGYDFSTPYLPCLKKVNGVKVLFISANEWACPMNINLPERVRIIHYNHAIWPSKYRKDVDGKPFLRGKVQSAQTVPAM